MSLSWCILDVQRWWNMTGKNSRPLPEVFFVRLSKKGFEIYPGTDTQATPKCAFGPGTSLVI